MMFGELVLIKVLWLVMVFLEILIFMVICHDALLMMKQLHFYFLIKPKMAMLNFLLLLTFLEFP